jgi:hypothetical protein
MSIERRRATHNGEIAVLNIGGTTGVTVAGRIATQRGAQTVAEDPKTENPT